MKKIMRFSIFGLLVFVLQANTPSAIKVSDETSQQPNTQKALLSYSWFLDEDFVNYTGYTSAVNAELTRLRTVYPYYIFSSTPGFGLIQFEYGFHPIDVPAIIYSNMNYE